MNKFDSFFNSLLPLRPLFPFVQTVLPTVFDDSLSYLETLGKVVKALNDTTSNVNTLEQAVRAFADDLAQYENLSITPVNVVFNNDTGTYTASMTYADIVSALGEGHTVIMHVTGSVYDTGIEFYSAALKLETTGANVRVLYWDSPVYIVDGNTVVYRAFINENNVPGVLRRVIDGDSGSTTLFVRYDSTQGEADKTYAEIMQAINNGDGVVLIADGYYISPARVAETFVEFVTGSLVSYSNGYNLGVILYTVTNNDDWSVLRRGFPDTARVDAMIDAKIGDLEGFNSIATLSYNESTGAVTYFDGAQTVNVTGYDINSRFLNNPKMLPVMLGFVSGTGGAALFAYYFPVRYGTVGNNEVVEFYRVFNGNYELVSVPWSSNIAVKTAKPIDGAIKKLVYNESTGNVVYYDGETSTPVTGENVVINFLSNPEIAVVLEGGVTTSGDTVYNEYVPLRYGVVSGVNIGVQFYRVYNGNIEIVTLPANSSVATKTSTPIGGGSAPYEIPVSVSGGVYSTTATGAEIFENRANCYAEINGVMYYPVGCSTSGPVGDVYLAAVDPHTVGSYDVEILQFHLTGANNIPAVTRYSNDIDAGETQKIMIAASSVDIPPLQPNKLYVFTGDAASLNITLAAPSDNNIANEYHFIFNSGATPTTLTLPSTINQPDGFTVEANHVYEVSILENNMLAAGWAVSGT